MGDLARQKDVGLKLDLVGRIGHRRKKVMDGSNFNRVKRMMKGQNKNVGVTGRCLFHEPPFSLLAMFLVIVW